MDISPYLELYRSTTENYGWYAFLLGVLAFGLFAGSLGASGWVSKSTGSDSSIVAGFFVGFIGFMICMVGSLNYGQATGPTNDLISSVAAEATEHYDVAVPEDAVKEAYKGSDTDVVSFGAEHDGAEKALALRFNEETETLTVYQGNVELDADKK